LVESAKYAVSAKFDESAKCLVMTQQKCAVSTKNWRVSKKYAVSAKTCRVSKIPVNDSTIHVLNILCMMSFSF